MYVIEVTQHLIILILQNGFTPLMAASEKGHLSVVELLVFVGAQVNSQDNVSNWMYNRTVIVYTVSL